VALESLLRRAREAARRPAAPPRSQPRPAPAAPAAEKPPAWEGVRTGLLLLLLGQCVFLGSGLLSGLWAGIAFLAGAEGALAAAAVFLLTLTLVARVAEAVGSLLLLGGPARRDLRQLCLGAAGLGAGLAALLFLRLIGSLFAEAPPSLGPAAALHAGGFDIVLLLMSVLDFLLSWGRLVLLQFYLYKLAVFLRTPDLPGALLLSLKILAGAAGGGLVLLFLACGGALVEPEGGPALLLLFVTLLVGVAVLAAYGTWSVRYLIALLRLRAAVPEGRDGTCCLPALPYSQ